MDPITVFNQSPIKGTFVCHFMLITWALITSDWMPQIFLFYNMLLFICLFWSLHAAQNPEPVQLAAIINLLSILLDVMCIATNYNRYHQSDWFGFSLFLLICNLLLRPITSILLFRIYNDRNDRFGTYGLDSRHRGHGGGGGPFHDEIDPLHNPRSSRHRRSSSSSLIDSNITGGGGRGIGGATFNGYQNLDAEIPSSIVVKQSQPTMSASVPYQGQGPIVDSLIDSK